MCALPVQGQRQAGSVTVVHKPRKGAPAAAPGPQRPERPVVNCLCCGKVYRTRGDSPDVLRFLGAPHDRAWPFSGQVEHPLLARICGARVLGCFYYVL